MIALRWTFILYPFNSGVSYCFPVNCYIESTTVFVSMLNKSIVELYSFAQFCMNGPIMCLFWFASFICPVIRFISAWFTLSTKTLLRCWCGYLFYIRIVHVFSKHWNLFQCTCIQRWFSVCRFALVVISSWPSWILFVSLMSLPTQNDDQMSIFPMMIRIYSILLLCQCQAVRPLIRSVTKIFVISSWTLCLSCVTL